MTPRSFTAILIAIAICAVDAATARGQTPAAPIEIAGKFDTSTDELLIPVRFAGSQVWCALDTGFSALIVIDRQKAAAVGLDIKPPLPLPDGTPPKTTDASASVPINVGTVDLGQRNVIVRDLPDEVPDMECVFGAAALSRFVIEMDYEHPRARLIPHEAFTPAPGFVEVPLIFRTNPNVAFVRVTFRFADGTEQQAQMVADTGTASYAALVIDPLASQIRPRLGPTAEPTHVAKGPSGPIKISAARPAAMVIGPVTIEQPVIALLESDFGSGGMDDGLLGCGFFRRFIVAFDYQGRHMYVRPNAHRSDPHLYDASGVYFRPSGRTFVVENVLPGTAAADAGLKKGDELIDLDDRSADTLAPTALRDALSQPGQTRRLRVLRGDQMMRITLLLRKRL